MGRMTDGTNDETSEKTYLGRDLQDHIVVPEGETVDPGYHRRSDYLEAMLPDQATVKVAMSGGYQGELVAVVAYNGYIWLAHDYYGSCSLCDGFIDNEEPYIRKLIRDMYCFADKDDAQQYLEHSVDYGWDGADLREPAQEAVETITI